MRNRRGADRTSPPIRMLPPEESQKRGITIQEENFNGTGGIRPPTGRWKLLESLVSTKIIEA